MGYTEAKSSVAANMLDDTFYNDEGGSIKDFLSRPRVLFQTSLAATDNATTFGKIDILKSLLLEFPEKLKGKYAARFDIVLNVEVSADRFHQGRYMLCYLPVYHKVLSNASGTVTTSPIYATTHASTLTQCTQLQHVEFDISVDKSAKLVIPWRYINPYIELAGASYYGVDASSPPGYGIVFLRPYSPLALGSAGATTSSISVWASMENVKFYGTADYQSSSDQELKSVGEGPISGPLTSITKTLNGISDLPFIGHYTRPASWVTEALARAAKHFGFSSPALQAGVHPILNMPHAYNANADMPRPVQSLSLNQSNAVSIDPGVSGSKIDEMSIDYLKQIYAYKTGFDYTSSNAVNTLLFETAVNPLLPYNTTTITNATPAVTYTLANHCPAGYMATKFRYWRGSIKYRIKLVKTEFHTGKLLVCWVPFNNQAQPYTSPPTVDGSYYRYRQIIDISQGNEFEFIVPYMSPRPWKSVLQVENGGFVGSPSVIGDARASATDFANGYFSIIVVDQLRAPDVASQTVRILLEAAGGEDFELCDPANSLIYNNGITYSTPKTAWVADYQSAKEGKVISSYTFGGHNPMSYDQNVTVASIAGGEKVDSLRKLMKRYTTAYISSDSNVHKFIVTPWSGMGLMQQSSTVVIGNQVILEDDFAYFGAMFNTFRGSVRCKFYCSANGSGTGNLTRQQLTATLIDSTTGQRSLQYTFGFAQPTPPPAGWPNYDQGCYWASSRALATATLSEALEFSIPFYTQDSHYCVQGMYQPEAVTASQAIPSVGSGEIGSVATAAIVDILTGATIVLTKRFERSLGEDASFSNFVSCPPIWDQREQLVL